MPVPCVAAAAGVPLTLVAPALADSGVWLPATGAKLDNHLALVTPSRMAALLEQAKALTAEFDALYTMHKKVGAVALVAWVGSR